MSEQRAHEPEDRIPERVLSLLRRALFAPLDPITFKIPAQYLDGGTTGTPGEDGIMGWVTASDGLAWVRAAGAGAWTPASTTTTLTVVFYQGALLIATRTLTVTLNTGAGTLSCPADTVNGITATRTGNGTAALTVTFTHDDSLAVVGVALSATQGGADGVDGLDGLDGSNAKLVVLVSDAQVFQITNAGVNTPSAINFTAFGQNLAGSPTFSVTAGTATLTGTGTTRQLTFANLGSDAATIKVAWDGQEDYLSVAKVREGDDGADGTDGDDAVTSLLTNEAHTVPADAAGTVTSFAGASTQMRVFLGVVDDSSNWSFSNADTNCTSGLVGAVATVTALSADVGYVDITATRTGYATQVKRFTISKSKAGTNGVDGDPGPGVVFRGNYSAAVAYYHTATRRDIVYHSSAYWIADNVAKNGLTTWGTPGTADWASFGATFSSVATAILLAEDATILKTLTMGDGTTSNAGIIRSAAASAFGTGAGFWLGYDGTTVKFRVGDPAGDRIEFDPGATAPIQLRATQMTIGMDPESTGVSAYQERLQVSDRMTLFGFNGGTALVPSSVLFQCRIAGGTQASKLKCLANSGGGWNLRAWNGSSYREIGRWGFTSRADLDVNESSLFSLHTKTADATPKNNYVEFDEAGRLSIAKDNTAPVFRGRFTITEDGTTAAEGMYFGSDVTLYRSAANVLRTDDLLAAAGVVSSEQIGADRGIHAGAIPAEYAGGFLHRHNTTGKYGLFCGTAWAAAENIVFRAAYVDATSGAITPRLDVLGDGNVKFYGTILDNNGDKVLDERYGSALPADATDEASAVTLVNALKAMALHHGLAA